MQSLQQWKSMLTDLTNNSSLYVYQINDPDKGLSIEMLHPSQFAEKYESLLGSCFPLISKDCLESTKKLSLREILWMTEKFLELETSNLSMKELKGKFEEITDGDIDVDAALNETSRYQLLKSLQDFYAKRVEPHRVGFKGYLRELISLVMNVFHKCLRGNQFYYQKIVGCTTVSKKEIIRRYLQVFQSPDQASDVIKSDTPGNPTPPKTPISTLEKKGILDPTEADQVRRLRDSLKKYLNQ